MAIYMWVYRTPVTLLKQFYLLYSLQLGRDVASADGPWGDKSRSGPQISQATGFAGNRPTEMRREVATFKLEIFSARQMRSKRDPSPGFACIKNLNYVFDIHEMDSWKVLKTHRRIWTCLGITIGPWINSLVGF